MPLRIVLASDIRLFREGLVPVLSGRSDLEVVGAVPRPEEVLGAVRELSPDVTLLDVAIPGGLEPLRDVATLAPDTRVLALAIAGDCGGGPSPPDPLSRSRERGRIRA